MDKVEKPEEIEKLKDEIKNAQDKLERLRKGVLPGLAHIYTEPIEKMIRKVGEKKIGITLDELQELVLENQVKDAQNKLEDLRKQNEPPLLFLAESWAERIKAVAEKVGWERVGTNPEELGKLVLENQVKEAQNKLKNLREEKEEAGRFFVNAHVEEIKEIAEEAGWEKVGTNPEELQEFVLKNQDRPGTFSKKRVFDSTL